MTEAAILVDGRVEVSGVIDDLKLNEKRVRVAGPVPESALLAVPGVRRVTKEPAGWLLFVRGDASRVSEALRSLPGVTGVQVFDQSLEEILLSYINW